MSRRRLDDLIELADELGLDDEAADLLETYLEQAQRAREAYEAFHWEEEIDGAEVVTLPVPSGVLWTLGPCVQIVYEATKGGELTHWEHDFTEPRPVLAYDEQTGTLHLVGGSYRVTDRGIVG